MQMNCRRCGLIFLGVSLAFLVCAVFGLIFAAGSNVVVVGDSLGQPSADMQDLEQILLTLYLFGNASALDRASGEQQEVIEFYVQEGENAAQVITRLEQMNLVSNGFLLRNYLRYRGLDVSIESGAYSLSGSMTIRELAEALQRALPPQTTLVVLEGWRIEQISEQLEEISSHETAQEFLRAVETHPADFSFNNEFPEPVWIEGFLFPDTYLLEPDSTGDEIAGMMLANFNNKLDQELLNGFREQGLELHQAVTLASIVEREAVRPEERPLIAAVFLNRLALGMKLEADPTVQYALGKQANGEWWKSPLSLQDLAFDSPYNTYIYPDLPPRPIANPGLNSLQAVAKPEPTDYLYFRARCDDSGFHNFAITFEEHLENACP